MAGLVGVLADLVARDQFESHAQRRARRAALRCSVSSASSASARPGVFAVRKKTLVELARAPRLEQREKRGERLADAGGRLRHQAARRRAPRGRRPPPARAARCETAPCGNGSAASAASRAARCATSCSAQARNRSHCSTKKISQVSRGCAFVEHRFLLAADVEVDQRDRQLARARACGTAASRRRAPAPSAARGGWPASRSRSPR